MGACGDDGAGSEVLEVVGADSVPLEEPVEALALHAGPLSGLRHVSLVLAHQHGQVVARDAVAREIHRLPVGHLGEHLARDRALLRSLHVRRQIAKHRLFDPFATGRPGGTGLGLAIRWTRWTILALALALAVVGTLIKPL